MERFTPPAEEAIKKAAQMAAEEAIIEAKSPHQELKAEARKIMVTLLTREQYGELPTLAEKAGLLRTLILEKGVVQEGTNLPLDNSHRFLVEALAEKLTLVEKFEDEEIQALTQVS